MPATSVQLPATCGAANTARVQAATPEVASLPKNARVTGWLNQPSWSGGRSGRAPVTFGGVRSMRMTAVRLAFSPLSASCTSQNTGVPGVSALKNCGVQSPATGTAATVSKAQPSLTSLRYQPLQSLGAGVQT